MTPQMEKTYPAGVIRVKLASEIAAVFFPPSNVVLPAKPLTETIKTIKMAKSAGYRTVGSPRSGKLWDPYIVHLCVGQNLGQGKLVRCPSGGPYLNELIRIGDYLEYKKVAKLKRG